jgi:transposase
MRKSPTVGVIASIAGKIVCTAEMLGAGYARASVTAACDRPTTAWQQGVNELEREVRELRRANEILNLASAFFAQAELDRRLK